MTCFVERDENGHIVGRFFVPQPGLATEEVADNDAELLGFLSTAENPVPPGISDRQFAQGLATRGFITEAEALAWVSAGTLPAAIDAFVASLPASDRFGARMILQGATTFERAHPFTAAFGSAVGMDATALDSFWRECAAL